MVKKLYKLSKSADWVLTCDFFFKVSTKNFNVALFVVYWLFIAVIFDYRTSEYWEHPGRIKTLLLRRKNDCFGAKFCLFRQPLRPAAAAAAIEEPQ